MVVYWLDSLMTDVKRRARRAGAKYVKLYDAVQEHFAAEVARELALLRIVQRLSQSELGRRSHLAQAEVSRILSGKSDPRIGTVQKLARAMGAELRIVRPAGARIARVPAKRRRK